jgi:hypothetical protein
MPEYMAEQGVVAELLKKYFNAAKSEQQGKPYRPHPRYRRIEIWLAAADIAIEMKADPYDFIKAAFLFCTVPGGPYPQNLAANCARRWYSIYRQSAVKNGKFPDSIFKDEITNTIQALARQMMTSGKRPRDFLLDTFLTKEDVAPAFTRVLLLSKDPDILAKFGRKARSEIVGNQKLLTILQELKMDLSWLDRVK